MSSDNRPHRITLIVAALNEEAVIADTVRSILAVVTGRFADFEMILVDDGSSDRTGAIMDGLASHPKLRVIHNRRNEGLGATYRRGIAEARFEYLMLLCGDGGLPAAGLPPIFDAIGSADIVAPYMTNLRRIKTPARYFMSWAYTTLLNRLFGQHINYYNGLGVHRTDLLRQITITSTRFAFQGEVLIKLLKSGCSYVQVATIGAENTHKSSALQLRNLTNVATTLVALFREISRFDSTSVRRPAVSEETRDDADGSLEAGR